MTRLLQIAAGLTLVGLALMVWSMLVPTPMPVILAMSVGQLVGTVAFGMFGYAVLVDQLRKQRARGVKAARAARAAASAPANGSSSEAAPGPSSEAAPGPSSVPANGSSSEAAP